MPVRRNLYRRRRRRYGRRRRGKFKRTGSYGRQVGFYKTPVNTFAQRKFVQFNFTRVIGTDANSTSVNGTSFRVNSLSQPILNGQQRPYGYDQWKQFYNRYRVHAVKVHVQASIRNTNGTCIMFIGTNAVQSDIPSLREAYDDPNYRYWTWSQNKPIIRKKYFTINGIEGRSKAVTRGALGYSALFDNNPGNSAWVAVGFANADTSGADIQIDYRVTLKFYCELTEPKALPGSIAPDPPVDDDGNPIPPDVPGNPPF